MQQQVIGLESSYEPTSHSFLRTNCNMKSFVTVNRASNFREISNEQFVQFLADALLNQIHLNEGQHQEIESNDDDIIVPGSSGFQLLSQSPVALCRRLLSHLIDDINDTYAKNIDLGKARFMRLLRDRIVFANDPSSTSGIFQSNWQHIIDSGSQQQFHDMLPQVYRNPSFQIVLMRLTECLQDKPKMQYALEGKAENLSLTNLQYIERACQIAFMCDSLSKVMIVGTHKDELESQIGVDEAKEKIDNINKCLKKKLFDNYKDVLVYESDDLIIFDINTMAVGEERERDTQKLQEIITDFTEESFTLTKPKNVSLKWLCFHFAINQEPLGVISFQDCLTIGKTLGMNSDSVTKSLKYFSDVGLVLYFPDEKSQLIVTKVHLVLDQLSNIIKAIFQPSPVRKGKCDDFKMHGIFDKDFFDGLYRAGAKSSQSIAQASLDSEKIFKLLLHLKIAVSIGNGEYFLPSALSLQPQSDDELLYSAQSDHVLLYSESCGFALQHHKNKKCILPHGFFFTTAIELHSGTSRFLSRDYIKFELRKDIQQYRDSIQFSCEDSDEKSIADLITLIDKKWWIQLTVANKQQTNPKHLQKIHHTVEVSIKRAIKTLKHDTKSLIKEVFPCPEKHHEDHYCTLTRDKSQYKCSLSQTKSKLMEPAAARFMIWSGRKLNYIKHYTNI